MFFWGKHSRAPCSPTASFSGPAHASHTSACHILFLSYGRATAGHPFRQLTNQNEHRTGSSQLSLQDQLRKAGKNKDTCKIKLTFFFFFLIKAPKQPAVAACAQGSLNTEPPSALGPRWQASRTPFATNLSLRPGASLGSPDQLGNIALKTRGDIYMFWDWWVNQFWNWTWSAWHVGIVPPAVRYSFGVKLHIWGTH